jgi:hypothetical protein
VAPNGDQVYWLNIGFRCRFVCGDAHAHDDESIEVAWFEADSVPELEPHQARCLALALTGDAQPWFVSPADVAIR